jgi:hypothetical protein
MPSNLNPEDGHTVLLNVGKHLRIRAKTPPKSSFNTVIRSAYAITNIYNENIPLQWIIIRTLHESH